MRYDNLHQICCERCATRQIKEYATEIMQQEYAESFRQTHTTHKFEPINSKLWAFYYCLSLFVRLYFRLNPSSAELHQLALSQAALSRP